MAAQPVLDPLSVAPFGKYRLVRHLATGHLADSFLAVVDGDANWRRACVVKKMRRDYAQTRGFRDALVREAQQVARYDHPNILPIYDFGWVGEEPFIAVEYVAGVTLEHVITQAHKLGKALGVRAAVEVGTRVCAALAHASAEAERRGHLSDVVHRDICPGNIYLSARGELRLANFGMGALRATVAAPQVAGRVKSAYLSPEQLAGGAIDRRSDLFSLAHVMWEMALGQRLFTRDGETMDLMAVATADVPLPRGIDPDFPAGLEAILLRALNKRRDERFAQAAELGAQLEAFRDSQGWSADDNVLAALVQRFGPLPTLVAPPEAVPVELRDAAGDALPALPSASPGATPARAEVAVSAWVPAAVVLLAANLVGVMILALTRDDPRARAPLSAIENPAVVDYVATQRKLGLEAFGAGRYPQAAENFAAALGQGVPPGSDLPELLKLCYMLQLQRVDTAPSSDAKPVDVEPVATPDSARPPEPEPEPKPVAARAPARATPRPPPPPPPTDVSSAQAIARTGSAAAAGEGAFVVVTSAPAGLYFFFDGVAQGRTPRRVETAPGLHTVTLRKDGKQIFTRDVIVRERQVETVHADVRELVPVK